jgi:hypothetical protein
MGTALSPDAANIFMALCEDVQGVYQHATLSALLPNTKCLLLFTRLIDDYTIILAGVDDTSTLAFLHELDRRVQPYLRITWQVSVKAMNTLDLHIYLPENFRKTGKFVYRTHQKPGNRYTLLPFTSLHPIWTKKAIVKAEITRHATNCSTESWLRYMSNLYFIRQLYRGFPANLFLEWTSAVSNSSVRQRLSTQTADRATGEGRRVPLYLKLKYDDVSKALNAPSLLHQFSSALSTGGSKLWDRCLVCWCRGTNLGSRLWSSQDAATSCERVTTPNP